MNTTPAQKIVAALRGKWYGSYGTVLCTAHQERHPSLRIRDGDTGTLLLRCYAGCAPIDIIAGLKRMGLWPERPQQRERRPEPRRRYATPQPQPTTRQPRSEAEQHRIAFAREIMDATADSTGTILERYWHEARGITLPIPSVIRFGVSVPYGYSQPGKPPPRRYPGMVAQVQAPDGSFAGVHVTYLARDGRGKESALEKARLVFGCVGGAAIRLAENAEELAIGEGIESTASYMQEAGVAGWAAMNAGSLRTVILPWSVKLVTLLGENDAGPSENAIAAASERLRREGRLVEAVFPSDDLKDFNEPHRQAA